MLKRIANAAVVLCIVAVIVFLMVHIVPGDPARLILGDRARVEDVEALRQRLGFDRPLHEQFRRLPDRLSPTAISGNRFVRSNRRSNW